MSTAVLARPPVPSRVERQSPQVGRQHRSHPRKTLREVLAVRGTTIVTASGARLKADIANRYGDAESEEFYDGLHQDLWEQARRSADEYAFGALGVAGI